MLPSTPRPQGVRVRFVKPLLCFSVGVPFIVVVSFHWHCVPFAKFWEARWVLENQSGGVVHQHVVRARWRRVCTTRSFQVGVEILVEADQLSEGSSVVWTVHHNTDLAQICLPEIHVHHWL